MRTIMRLFIIICIMMAGPMQAITKADALERPIRIGYTEHPGFIEQKADGSYVGLGAEYFDTVADYTGWKYEYVCGSRSELEEKLDRGELDFIAPVMKTEERVNRIYRYPLHTMGTAMSGLYVSAAHSDIYYEDYMHMRGIKIGGTKGSFQMMMAKTYARAHGFDFTEVDFPDYMQALDALDRGEIDAVALSSLYRVEGYRLIATMTYAPFYVVAGKKSGQALLAELDATMEKINYEHSDFLSNIFEKYYGRYNSNAPSALTRLEHDYIEEGHQVRVGCYTDWYPLVYYDKAKDEVAGILIDVFHLIEKKSGLHFTFIPVEKDSSIAALKECYKGIDLFIAVVATKERRQDPQLVLSHGYIDNDRAFAGLRNRTFDLHQSYTIAIPAEIKGSGAFLKENNPQFTIVFYPDLPECFRAVKRGEADAAFQNSYIISAMLQHPEFQDMAVWDVSKQMGGEFFAAARSDVDPRLMAILNKTIDTLSMDDIQAIVFQHTSSSLSELSWMDFWYKYSLTIKIAGGLLVLILIIVMAGIMANRRHIALLHAKNRQLSEAISQADMANRAKSDFLSRMSHEIRTPMNAIIGLTEIAHRNVADQLRVTDALLKIEDASKLLLNIINDVLDMSAIEHRRLQIAQEPFDFRQMLKPLLALYEQQCVMHHVQFQVTDALGTVPLLLGDEKRLSQVVVNLLSNAVKFTPTGGKITVQFNMMRSDAERIYLQIAVTDTGIGMTEEFQQRLFKPFEQASANTFQKFGGSGLGLSIAHNLVKLMNGEISVESQTGSGTRFRVDLPFTRAKEAETYRQTDEKREAVVANIFQGKRFLLVEDNEINRMIVEELLRSTGAAITMAENGKIACELFAAAAPYTFAAILMDIQMPVMNGYEAARAIRASNRADAKEVPIIAVTADAFSEDVAKALSAGMNEHIAKPINLQELCRVLQELIAG